MSVLEAHGNRTHFLTVNASEMTRQVADQAALATFLAGGTSATYAASLKTAAIADYRRRLASAIAAGVSPVCFMDGLRVLGINQIY